eukprot:TRINITY_DN960_c0_g1_i1.p1 TRINITY_DN960_c0_g1~~TRINITY_DN960_c0_g1_i1.p1  ORF type:complete len:309 (+),score=76.25 TRINITY_DN960_c0_g1_i1:628-1554(+)
MVRLRNGIHQPGLTAHAEDSEGGFRESPVPEPLNGTTMVISPPSALGISVNHNDLLLPPHSSLLHFPVLSQQWTAEELRTLEQGLATFSAESEASSLLRYVKIAALLPEKSARDVALRYKGMLKKDVAKRKRPEEVPPPVPVVKKSSKEKKEKSEQQNKVSPVVPRPPSLPAAPPALLPAPPAASPPLPHAMPNPAQVENAEGAAEVKTEGPGGNTTAELLQVNGQLFDLIKSNATAQKVQENNDLFLRLKDNILSILNGMTGMPGIMSQMPPLPVKLNLELANQILPKAMGPPPSTLHHPPQRTLIS